MVQRFLSNIFTYAVKFRNQRYDSGNAKIISCNVPVISIGNISVGGSSKTPFVKLVAELLKENQIKFAIVARGYKKHKKGTVVVRDEIKVISSLEESGDEMRMLAEKLDCPIIVSENKTAAALHAQANFEIECIVIDDGFQHRRLFRDLDIVLINNETLLKPELLPKGRLREPLTSLKRADIICYVGAKNEMNESLESTLSGITLKEDVLICKASVSLDNLYKLTEVPIKKENSININKYAAVAGIANPQRFYQSLINAGCNIEHTFWYKDHHYYNQKDILELITKLENLKIENIITTEKDAVKLRKWNGLLLEEDIQCWIAPLKLEMIEGNELFEKKLLNLFINQFENKK
jgi:tetraacyldisaccharide 4'-kinase